MNPTEIELLVMGGRVEEFLREGEVIPKGSEDLLRGSRWRRGRESRERERRRLANLETWRQVGVSDGEVSREDLLTEIEELWAARGSRLQSESMRHADLAGKYRAARGEALREAAVKPEQMWLKIKPQPSGSRWYTYRTAGGGVSDLAPPNPADIRTDPADGDEFAPIPTQEGEPELEKEQEVWVWAKINDGANGVGAYGVRLGFGTQCRVHRADIRTDPPEEPDSKDGEPVR